jgi:phosphonopyruvate decarboxylase
MSINPKYFLQDLISHDISFFAGVPDSLLQDFCLCVDDIMSDNQNIIAANEGNAIALATGYHLATNKLPLVYMQNSGLGNAINPLLSLCDPDVYSIPLLVMIGWRGEPGVKDEPQHAKQGKVQIDLLKAMDLPFEIISKDDNHFGAKISRGVETARKTNAPFVLLIKKGTFGKYRSKLIKNNNQKMKREEALKIILANLGDNTIIVSTTGKTSRELFEIREKSGRLHHQDFLTVGSMGHCSSIALGIALAKPHREVVCIDGDGAMLMHLGAITTIASLKPKNFHHILMNNEVHESVGWQYTAAKSVDLSAIVASTGSIQIFKAQTKIELESNISDFMMPSGPNFLEIKIQPGSRRDLGRPTIGPKNNKEDFMNFLKM